MPNFFPPGFWKTVAELGMLIFFIFGVDLLLGARLVRFLNGSLNKRFQVDQQIINALQDLKKRSDKEFDVDNSLMHGWGRLVMIGLLLFGAALIFLSVLPNL
jgi:hypothetical protein